MANIRNCDVTGAPIAPGDVNMGRGSHLLNVNDDLHLTVTPGRRDDSNEGIDLTEDGFATALEMAAAFLRKKVADRKAARDAAAAAKTAEAPAEAAPEPVK